MNTSTWTWSCGHKHTRGMYTGEIMNTTIHSGQGFLHLHTGTGESGNRKKVFSKHCLSINWSQLISTHKVRQSHTDRAQLKDTTLTLLKKKKSQKRCRWDWIQTCLLTGKIELLISQQIVLWGIHGSTPWLPSSLWLKECELNLYACICLCTCGNVLRKPGEASYLGKSPNYFLWAEWTVWART